MYNPGFLNSIFNLLIGEVFNWADDLRSHSL